MPQKVLNNEIYQFFIKILLPAILAIGFKIAVEIKKNKTKVTWLSAMLSFIIGISGAYFTSNLVSHSFSERYLPIIIAIIAITSEKIGEFLIYKLNVDVIMQGIFDTFFDYILKIKDKKE